MKTRVDRRTVELSSYPDLVVVVYLGMRVNVLAGMSIPSRRWSVDEGGGTGEDRHR